MPDYVCEDLIADIFERLPVKSLIRFRCLSKSWCCRISSPEFIRRHSTLRPSVQKVILEHEIYQNKKLHQMLSMLDSEDPLPLLLYGYTGTRPTFKLGDYSRAGSSNGIICLLNHNYDVISLWNPSIRRIFSIPPHMSLYAPLASVFGFGFDPITNDYKIVRLSCSHTAIVDSFVYTTNTGTWCKIALPTIPFSYTLSSPHGCCVNGALHWLAFANNSLHDRCIMRFDLSTHVISTIALPWEPRRYAGCLKILKGSTLAVITEYHRVWTMMKKEVNNDNNNNNNVASSASCWRMAASFNSI
uniref:putative F-box protein At3g16210 n=1 Tax=Erigeron canadensis TaxID=72917 RepID=UPI001CB958EE|nr:putative F-box protein At3g16210 [Erigeron canadensis]